VLSTRNHSNGKSFPKEFSSNILYKKYFAWYYTLFSVYNLNQYVNVHRMYYKSPFDIYLKSFTQILKFSYLFINSWVFIFNNWACNDISTSTTHSAEINLWFNKYIRDILKELDHKVNTLSSHKRGKWRTISRGVVSAAIMTSSAIPLLRVLVVSFAPFLS